MVTNYFSLIIKNPVVLGAIILLVILTLTVVIRSLTRHRAVKAKTLVIESIKEAAPIIKAASVSGKKGLKSETNVPKAPTPPEIMLGMGKFKCMAIRSAKVLGLMPGMNVIDFTTMPEPIGEIHLADTSCPISGQIYTVKENDDGTISDYDPREVVIVVDQTPEYCYFATHWPIVREVFGIPVSPLSNPSFWLAVAALAGAIFMGLATVGG